MPLPAPDTLGDALWRAARQAGGAPALAGDFGSLGWAALARRAAAVAATLAPLRCPAPQGRTRAHALVLRPDPDDIVVLLGHALAGIPVLPLHPALPAAEAARLTAAAGALALTVDDLLRDTPPTPTAASGRAVAPDDDLLWVPTSGSSGVPKVARLTHRAVLAAAVSLTRRLPFAPQDRWILTLPLSHVGGLSVLVRCVLARRSVVLVPRHSEAAVLRAVRRDGGTRLSAVPAIAHRLLQADPDATLRRLSLVMLGGQAAPQALRRALADAGVPAVASYGLTESCAAAACEPLADAGLVRPGSGTALDGMAIRITDADGRPQATGVPGTIRLRGTALLSGYADGTPAAVDDDGWLDTGDLGWLDGEGRLHVQGRRVELIVTGGEKVVPGVVEAALREHPGVRDAVVFGQDDARWGAIVCAAVEGDAGLQADKGLPALLQQLLPPWSRPRRLAVLATLPRLGNGKLDRRGTPAVAAPALRPWPEDADHAR